MPAGGVRAAMAVFLCLASVPWAGAAKPKPPQAGNTPPGVALSQYISRVRAEKAAEVLTPGSIWSANGRLTNLVSDVKAIRAHDPIAVVVSESLTASTDGTVKNQRASSASSQVSALLGKLAGGNALNNLLSQSSSSALNAQGQSVTDSSITTTLGGEVADVLPNGMLVSQQQSLDEQSTSVAGQANALLESIAQLNTQIEATSPDADAGTLEDQRQEDLTNLSQLMGIRTIPTENNGLTVTTTGGALLVSEGQAYQITTGESGGVSHFYDAQGGDITADLTSGGGQLGGILTARDQDIPQVENALDELAYSVGSAVNTQNEAGWDENGAAGTAIFSLPANATAANPAGSAAQISVTMTDPSLIAAAGTVPGSSPAVGEGPSDNTNVVAMANLQNQGIVNGISPTSYFSDMVTSLGSLTSEVSSENTAQQAALTQLQDQIGSVSGVNLNDEAAQLETFEQSYEAASKLFTTLDEVAVSALNLGAQETYST